VVADYFVYDEAQELLGELGIQVRFLGQLAQARDLLLLPPRIGGGQGIGRLVLADRLGDAEPLRQDMDQGGVDIVDAAAEGGELRVACGV